MAEQMFKRRQWTISCLQRPAAAHIAITDASQANWKDFVNAMRECIKAMKEDPSLNVNHDTALYGMTGMVPDKQMLHEFCCIH